MWLPVDYNQSDSVDITVTWVYKSNYNFYQYLMMIIKQLSVGTIKYKAIKLIIYICELYTACTKDFKQHKYHRNLCKYNIKANLTLTRIPQCKAFFFCLFKCEHVAEIFVEKSL